MFVNETKSAKQLNIEDVIYLNNKKIFSKNATRVNKKGNNSGGLAFIVDNNLKCRVKYLSNRVGQLRLNNLCILGVYLTYCDSSLRSFIDLEAELELIFQTVSIRQKEGYDCLIIGDFNIDMVKHPERSNLLQNYLNTFKYELLDQKHEMSSNYTYQMIRKKKNSDEIEVIESFVDHVAASSNNLNVRSIDVICETGNNSDHNMILLNYDINVDSKMEDVHTKTKKENKLFDWNDKEFVENYKNRIKSKLESSNYRHMLNELKKCKEKKKSHKLIGDFHKELQSIVIECVTKAHNELNLTLRSSRMRRRRKVNHWWNDELKDIYEKKKSAYLEYKNSGYDEKLKEKFLEYKRLFKLQKRFNIDVKRNKNLQLINNMFKMNKTNFWRQVKKLNKNNIQIDAKIEDINNDYNNLFNMKHESTKSMSNECKIKISKLIEDFDTLDSDNCPLEDAELTQLLREKIKDLSNNKAVGLSGLSNEMLKNGITTTTSSQEDTSSLISSIATLFKAMIANQYVPNFFNFSIIKPLVKDTNKETDNINNLRGIAISDTLQNL